MRSQGLPRGNATNSRGVEMSSLAAVCLGTPNGSSRASTAIAAGSHKGVLDVSLSLLRRILARRRTAKGCSERSPVLGVGRDALKAAFFPCGRDVP